MLRRSQFAESGSEGNLMEQSSAERLARRAASVDANVAYSILPLDGDMSRIVFESRGRD